MTEWVDRHGHTGQADNTDDAFMDWLIHHNTIDGGRLRAEQLEQARRTADATASANH
jgi:hypothetical protein